MVRDAAAPMVDLNTTPLIDVMLVLLIIFMISAPLLTHRLPIPNALPTQKPSPPGLSYAIGMESVGAGISFTLDGALVSRTELIDSFRQASRLPAQQQPRFSISPATDVRFDAVANLLAEGQRLGVARLSLDSD